EADAELLHDVAGIGEDVHEMRDRRALVAGDVTDAALQERLGDGQDAFAAKLLAGADPQLLNFLRERTLGHGPTFKRRSSRPEAPLSINRRAEEGPQITPAIAGVSLQPF